MSAATATDVAREVVLAVDKSRKCLDNRWTTGASSPTNWCARLPGSALSTRTPTAARTIFSTRHCTRYAVLVSLGNGTEARWSKRVPAIA